MNLRRRLAYALPLLAFALPLSACCGDLAQTPQVRKDFVERFNADPDLSACKLEASGPDLETLTLNCPEQDLAWAEQRLKPVCSSFDPFGFTALTAVGKDGRARVALGAGCAFTPETAP